MSYAIRCLFRKSYLDQWTRPDSRDDSRCLTENQDHCLQGDDKRPQGILFIHILFRITLSFNDIHDLAEVFCQLFSRAWSTFV